MVTQMDYSFRCEAKRRQNHQHSLEVHLVAGNVADVRCLVSQRLAGSSVLVGLVLGLLSLCKEPTVSDDAQRRRGRVQRCCTARPDEQ